MRGGCGAPRLRLGRLAGRPGRARPVLLAGLAALVAAAALLGAGALVASHPSGSLRPSPIYPVPQSMRFRGPSAPVTPQVSIVAGRSADPSALET